MEQYHQLLKEILGKGNVQFEPRTQEYTLGISAWQSVYDLRKGFPLITTKNVPPRLPFEELFWKLRGERNVKSLVGRNVHIWTANAFDRYLKKDNLEEKFPKHSLEWNNEFKRYEERIANDSEFALEAGDLGPVYGYQWRHWGARDGREIDQLANLLKGIKEKPGSRYHVLCAWNVGDLPEMALGPCPFWHQFSIFKERFLHNHKLRTKAEEIMDLTMVQRSGDTYLGVPFNIAQDALLLKMVAKETGFKPRFFNHQLINAHVYLGVPPRSDFWMDEKNVYTFQLESRRCENLSDYLYLRDWYLKNAPAEGEGNERKDHIPFILEQLSKEPRDLPSISLEDIPLLEAIQFPVEEVVKVKNYNPQKWDSKAIMAA